MSLVLANEETLVRKMCGEPDDTELSDDTLEAFFTSLALSWINSRRPAKKIGSFVTIADQQDYDEKPSAAYYVTKVWWLDATWLKFSPTMEIVPGSLNAGTQFADINALDSPELVESFYKKINYYQDFFKGRGRETEEGKIRLMPPPTTAGESVYFEYTYARWSAITLVANEYVEAVRNYAAMCAMRHLAIKRGVITGTRNFTGGGGRMEKDMMKDFSAEAERLVPISAEMSIG